MVCPWAQQRRLGAALKHTAFLTLSGADRDRQTDRGDSAPPPPLVILSQVEGGKGWGLREQEAEKQAIVGNRLGRGQVGNLGHRGRRRGKWQIVAPREAALGTGERKNKLFTQE